MAAAPGSVTAAPAERRRKSRRLIRRVGREPGCIETSLFDRGFKVLSNTSVQVTQPNPAC
jgi:hypothetical protein